MEQELANFSGKRPDRKYFGLCRPCQVLSCGVNATVDNMWKWLWLCLHNFTDKTGQQPAWGMQAKEWRPGLELS